MARAFSFANRDDFKTWLQNIGTTTTTHDATYDAVLQAVSRQIERWCQRELHPYTATKYFTPTESDVLTLDDDLLAVTTLKHAAAEQSGARTYANTWATTDYDLEPYNAPDLEAPYTAIRRRFTGQHFFPVGVTKSVEIAGTWGYWVSTVSQSTLAEALDASETGVDLATGHGLKPLQTILVGSEQMFITSMSTNTATVKRGVNGTTAATHDNAATVYVYEYAPDLVQACYLLTNRITKRREAPFGVAGSAEMGTLTVLPKMDPDVKLLLNPYRRLFIGAA